MSKKTEHTPMMQQYLAIKADYPHAFLFFRLGDFYELFYEDAEKAARLLEITLTSRNKNADEQIPMAGVPHHSAQRYIDRLIELGYKVAICEQMEDPSEAKGMVRREVVQVITPGTVMQGDRVSDDENNYLTAITTSEDQYNLAYADLTTGELKVTQMADEAAVLNEVAALEAREVVLLPDALSEVRTPLEKYYDVTLSTGEIREVTTELQPLLTEVESELLPALELLLGYLEDTQMRSLDHLQVAQAYEPNHYLMFGQNVRRNLELTRSLRDGSRQGTLLWLLDRTETAMGGRLLRRWLEQPLIHQPTIEKRQDRVSNLINHFFERADLLEALSGVYDLERLVGKIAYGTANARDLIQLEQSLSKIPAIRSALEQMNDDESWTGLLDGLDGVPEVHDLIERAIAPKPPISVMEGDIIKAGYNEQLDKYRDALQNGKQWLLDLEVRERKATGINNLKIGYNKVFGYFIEITRANLDKLEEGRYERKQTLVNSERFITDELKEMEATILEAEEKSQALEYELFTEIRQQVKSYTKRLQQLARLVAEVDVLQSFSAVSEDKRYVRPGFIMAGQDVNIIAGRHPVVESVMTEQEYVPNDVQMASGTDILLITGPNMSGKSTYMRQLALIVIMAQMGCFVPAESAELPIFDRIFARIGAMDDLFAGQSTFMVEMTETNEALAEATPNSLLLFDEIGRGTATYDGMALAEAIIEHVHDHIGAKTLFSTHYHELTALEDSLSRVENVHVGAVEEQGELTFLHQVTPGTADRSYGVQVARLAGLPDGLLKRAETILERLEENKDAIFKQEDQGGEEATAPALDGSSADVLHEGQSLPESEQLGLFSELTPPEQEVLEELERVNINDLTPLTALNQLNDWVNRLRGGDDE